MAKAKVLYTGDGKYSGVHVTYYRAGGMVEVGGWYDSCVGIGTESFALVDFLTRIGLKAKEVADAADVMRVAESEQRKAKRLAKKQETGGAQ